MFIDQATIYVKAGDGGHGCIAFLREKHRPRGGPSGGDGGNGGNVILKVNPQLSTLHDITYKRHYRAGRGGHGSGNNRHGKNGEDVQIQVPPGTVVKDSETKQVICDLTVLDESIIIA
ncbi:MAG: GTPase ObgE, partial [Fidelibacterota bacterium]